MLRTFMRRSKLQCHIVVLHTTPRMIQYSMFSHCDSGGDIYIKLTNYHVGCCIANIWLMCVNVVELGQSVLVQSNAILSYVKLNLIQLHIITLTLIFRKLNQQFIHIYPRY